MPRNQKNRRVGRRSEQIHHRKPCSLANNADRNAENTIENVQFFFFHPRRRTPIAKIVGNAIQVCAELFSGGVFSGLCVYVFPISVAARNAYTDPLFENVTNDKRVNFFDFRRFECHWIHSASPAVDIFESVFIHASCLSVCHNDEPSVRLVWIQQKNPFHECPVSTKSIGFDTLQCRNMTRAGPFRAA